VKKNKINGGYQKHFYVNLHLADGQRVDFIAC